MADTTTSPFGFTKPEIGASEDTWGTKLNANWEAVDNCLDGTTEITPKVDIDGASGDLKINGTAVTATATELNYVDGVTSAIQTQLDSKAPLASPELTGTPTAPTAASGTSTTQIATTAFVTTALQALYPVGSIYINADVETNPASLLGFGTWTAYGAGKVLVGQDAGDSSFDTLGETGGSKDAIVVSHSHTTTDASLTGSISGISESFAGGGSASGVFTKTTGIVLTRTPVDNDTGDCGGVTFDGTHSHTVSTEGSSGTNANLQPYVVVKMWKRTA
jgi:hypothetical protein